MPITTEAFVGRLVARLRENETHCHKQGDHDGSDVAGSLADKFERGDYTPYLAATLLLFHDDARTQAAISRARIEMVEGLGADQYPDTPDDFMRAIFHKSGLLKEAA